MPKNEENLLKEKLNSFFNNSFNKLFSKFEKDINNIEDIKYDFYDNCIKEYNLLEEKLTEEKNERIEIISIPKKDNSRNRDKNLINSFHKSAKFKNNNLLNKTFDNIIENKTNEGNNKNKEKHHRRLLTKQIINFNQHKLVKIPYPNSHRERPKTPVYTRKDSKKDLEIHSNIDKKIKKVNISNIKKEKSYNEKKENVKKEKNNLTKQKLKNNIQNVKIHNKSKEKIIQPNFIYQIPNSFLNSKILSCLYICIKNNFLTEKEKVKVILSNKILYLHEKNNLEKIKEVYEKEKEKIKEKEKEKIDLNKKNEISIFTPSKTALNCLIYITKEEMSNLKNNTSVEIGLIFKLIYIIIDENYNENTTASKLIENFIKVILLKYKVKDLKNLLIHYCNKNTNLNLNQTKIDKIKDIINKNPKLISNNDIKKINRPLSYITYLLKEIHDYINNKNDN